MDTSKGAEETYKVDTTNYKKSAGHEEPQKEDVKITHVPLTYQKRETGDSLAEKIESAKETIAGAGGGATDEHNKKN